MLTSSSLPSPDSKNDKFISNHATTYTNLENNNEEMYSNLKPTFNTEKENKSIVRYQICLKS